MRVDVHHGEINRRGVVLFRTSATPFRRGWFYSVPRLLHSGGGGSIPYLGYSIEEGVVLFRTSATPLRRGWFYSVPRLLH